MLTQLQLVQDLPKNYSLQASQHQQNPQVRDPGLSPPVMTREDRPPETTKGVKQLFKDTKSRVDCQGDKQYCSLAYLKINKYGDIIANCRKLLKEEDDCLKTAYRRGLAYTKYQDFKKAKNDFNKSLKHDFQNALSQKQLRHIAVAEKALQKQK